MSAFAQRLRAFRPDVRGRKWIFVAYDQLTDQVGPLAHQSPRELGIVLVEAPQKAQRRPYHRQKLALLLSNLRHFALEQAARGVAVRHVVAPQGYASALSPLVRELGGLTAMRPAERELREELRGVPLEWVRNETWLTTEEDFELAQPGPPWRMDAFYRHVRKRTGLLMRGGKPEGGRFSHDVENRKPWRGEPPAPASPTFPRDELKEEVADLVARVFPDHPGRVDLDSLPATRADAEALWSRALTLLPWFGPYEDAMSSRSTALFHTRVSGLLNLSRLLPARLVRDAAASSAPLASREGFVRQLLGWREFVRHVHEATDGFRKMPGATTLSAPGDGGYLRWKGKRWPATDGDGGAVTAHLEPGGPLPPAYWGAESGLNCLDTVVRSVWDEAYSHHITRLMVLGNLATLLGASARELTDWFWVAYLDAYDWVVEPNVLGMATYSAGDVMTTKPYVAGAAYIDRMSDFCGGCQFNPKRDCPITPLYWNFLARNEPRLRGIPRMFMPLTSVRRRSEAQKANDAQTAEAVRTALEAGERVGTAERLKPVSRSAKRQLELPGKGKPGRRKRGEPK